MVARLTLDQLVGVRIPVPQLGLFLLKRLSLRLNLKAITMVNSLHINRMGAKRVFGAG